ncbi:hypothetical protein P152DRAFT_301936 [Eremomyces bilateralis CBS 781.70]|uniref:Proteasome activator subunit 4 n=1 Tax=Eremomyces bilateralis CBS 781.70 TaxID=1392243 RepID=A0A6G1G7I0_9PEZI|nr:uncharacterized protein P152DRAFT_301936 [Eremomyces bilateralis CBS 781.70]KAF1814027.1 hypothetical protein P152DRAFT_301936 [Eremomyces bilateralis CBS 781.70]
MAGADRIAQLVSTYSGIGLNSDISRATSPGGNPHDASNVPNGLDRPKESRSRPRTFPYFKHLPYPTETTKEHEQNLNTIVEHLYVAVSAGDFAPGATHWTRELRGWLSLKFDLPRDTRVKLVRLYYELALAPGLEVLTAERFAGTFMTLTKRKHYLRNGKDLTLDWRPLFKELKIFVLPNSTGGSSSGAIRRNVRTLNKMCTFAQLYFDPREIPAMLEEFLPHFTTSFTEGAFTVVGLLNLLFPTTPGPKDRPDLQPQHYMPTFFHLWSLVNRSRVFDMHFLDLLSRLARDCLITEHLPWSQHGIYTEDQSNLIFTAILRLLEIPLVQSSSPYSSHVDNTSGLAALLERDPRKHPITHNIARWIVMSLSPACLDNERSILSNLEGLIEAVETYFHPSNSGSWTRSLSQLVYYLTDFFVMRWNREHSGEMEVPEGRRLTDEVKRRFVLCLREVTFMTIFSKSHAAISYALSSLQSLAYLEPNLIIPGALQRIYPALQGLVEVHRTISSIRALQMLAKVMARTRGYRCHVMSLLGLCLPGIDPNDLEKTLQTLAYIQNVSYCIPLCDLTKEKPHTDENIPNGEENSAYSTEDSEGTAVLWVQEQLQRLEKEGGDIEIDYEKEMTPEQEEAILRSSTMGLAEFVMQFIGRVFTLLENLPDSSRVKSGSPEESVVNTLPATFTPLLATLSPELYDIALNKIAQFVSNHVIHQARDAMAFICNALVKINPKKALDRLLPTLIAGIRTEIDDNGAGSTRTTGSEVLPRDRALVWNISLLSMCVVHVGDSVLKWKDELIGIAEHMQKSCKGIPTVHISNFVHHLLLNLTVTYTIDFSIYEKAELERGLTPADWGKLPDKQNMQISWHVPKAAEIEFAIEVFQNETRHALKSLTALTSENPPTKRDGTGKDWSDEVSRHLVLLRLILSGISVLFDPAHEIHEIEAGHGDTDLPNGSTDIVMKDPAAEEPESDANETEANLGEAEDEEVKPTFQYETGYSLDREGDQYKLIHQLRRDVGETLHRVHVFLSEKQEDDVACFNALYTAYKSWFVDVGIERSAHVLDRVSRLYSADILPFKFSGIRKEYPRPLLARRANVYHLQRLRHNANPRLRTKLDEMLLLDLAKSSVSLYTDIRRTAQSANENAVKCVIGSRPLVVPPLLDTLETAIAAQDYPRIKGVIYSLLFGSLAKTISKDWRFTPRLIKCFVEVTGVDKPSVQKLAANAAFPIMDMGKPTDRMVIVDADIVKDLLTTTDADEQHVERMTVKIQRRGDKIAGKRQKIEGRKAKLAAELLEVAKTAHWKKASRAAAIVINLGMRFEFIASEPLIEMLAKGAVDQHPSLRSLYSGALLALFGLVQTRAVAKHSYKNWLLLKEDVPDMVQAPTNSSDPHWTESFLKRFAQPDVNFYIDWDHCGWLVWEKEITGFLPDRPALEFDDVEDKVRKTIAKHLDRVWFSTYFSYIKQEPRDPHSDRFRVSSAYTLSAAFELVFAGLTTATFADIQELSGTVFGDGSDKHQHRATAEIMGGLISCADYLPKEQKVEIWEYAFPIVRGILRDGLSPETSSYWQTFLHVAFQSKDPRRAWPLVDWLASFKLDMSSNAAFKESSKIQALQQCILETGWHFQLEKPILEDFLAHLDHPYKGVREAMGQTLATIYRTRYHESYPNVTALVNAQKEAGSIGLQPYKPTEEFTATMNDIFERLQKWRAERQPGQQSPSSYTQGGKTVLLWLDSALTSFECTELIPFIPTQLTVELLHMMDIKEDQELQSLAYHVYKQIANVPHRAGEDGPFIASLISIGNTASSWHQRLRILINIQVLFYRELFLMSPAHQQTLFDSVSAMLRDPQYEVRLGASTTLSGMIRCSPIAKRDAVVKTLKARFSEMLAANPLPKRRVPGTPTPAQAQTTIGRHAAVLGLGALVQAFPYHSPPPGWLPEVLATLATKASGDGGTVGKSVKGILADFKKTRQDTWHVDVKAFEPEQLADLEGVLWKSYFA